MATSKSQPLSAYALASRLSYFLCPACRTMNCCGTRASGDLKRPDVLLAQTRECWKDDRFAEWLTDLAATGSIFRRFETNNSVDRERFPSFTTICARRCFRSRSGLSKTRSATIAPC